MDDWSNKVLSLLGDGRQSTLIRRVCEICVSELGMTGAGITAIAGPPVGDSQALIHTTNELNARLDELQLTLGEGPSVDAYTLGGPALAPDLAAEYARWPAFVPAALELGVAAMFSFPLQIGAARMGVLDLHRRTRGPLAGDFLAKAFALAEIGVNALLDDWETYGHDLPWLDNAHNAVHQATGVVTVQLGVSVHVALLRIRAYAYAHQLSLDEVGKQIVNRQLHLKMEE